MEEGGSRAGDYFLGSVSRMSWVVGATWAVRGGVISSWLASHVGLVGWVCTGMGSPPGMSFRISTVDSLFLGILGTGNDVSSPHSP